MVVNFRQRQIKVGLMVTLIMKIGKVVTYIVCVDGFFFSFCTNGYIKCCI